MFTVGTIGPKPYLGMHEYEQKISIVMKIVAILIDLSKYSHYCLVLINYIMFQFCLVDRSLHVGGLVICRCSVTKTRELICVCCRFFPSLVKF